MTVKAYGARAADKPLESMDIARRAPGPRDVQVDIAYCGVCHSDLHTVRSEWGGTLYPCVPGHEIVGQVSAVGGDVKAFNVGDTVGIDAYNRVEWIEAAFGAYKARAVAVNLNYRYGRHELRYVLDDADVASLKQQVLDSGLTTSSLVKAAWASAASFRGSDKRGGANGGRIRLQPANPTMQPLIFDASQVQVQGVVVGMMRKYS